MPTVHKARIADRNHLFAYVQFWTLNGFRWYDIPLFNVVSSVSMGGLVLGAIHV
jgi:hypothetical protein